VARGNRAGSVRSYAYALHRWWRFLAAVDVAWDKATTTEVRPEGPTHITTHPGGNRRTDPTTTDHPA
jgi:hypothetical protein